MLYLKRIQWHTCAVPAESNGAMPCQCGIDFTTDGMPRERIVQLAMRCDANSRTYNDDHPCREPRRLTLFRIVNNEGEFDYTLAYYKATGMHQATDASDITRTATYMQTGKFHRHIHTRRFTRRGRGIQSCIGDSRWSIDSINGSNESTAQVRSILSQMPGGKAPGRIRTCDVSLSSAIALYH